MDPCQSPTGGDPPAQRPTSSPLFHTIQRTVSKGLPPGEIGGDVCPYADRGTLGSLQRQYLVYYPADVPAKTKIPYVVYFSFVHCDGVSQENPGGLHDPDLDWPCTNPTGGKCPDFPPLLLQILFQSFLAQGYAVIFTTMIADDSYSYIECPTDKSGKKLTDPLDIEDPIYNLCWNSPQNPDRPYLQQIFADLYDWNNKGSGNPFALEYDACCLMGYSVGSTMVSRCINEFPSLRTTNQHPFPCIRAAVMVSGGSMHCYQFCNGGELDKTNRGYGGPLCDQQAAPYTPCFDNQIRGCCPKGLTEPNYDTGKLHWANHPPVILLQSLYDENADPNASTYYAEVLEDHHVPVEVISRAGCIHNLFPSGVAPILAFVGKWISNKGRCAPSLPMRTARSSVKGFKLALLVVIGLCFILLLVLLVCVRG